MHQYRATSVFALPKIFEAAIGQLIFVISMIALSVPTGVKASTVQLFEIGNKVFEVRVTGKIEKGDADKVRAALVDAQRLSSTSVERQSVRFDSLGGDVDAAMEIGRVIRTLGAFTTTGNCVSACVIAFAGGITRIAMTDDELKFGLGIHRIYFSTMSPNATLEQIRNMRGIALTRVRRYLSEMDVDDSLISQMEGISPERVRYLSQTEAERLRLVGQDSALDEQETAKSAWLYGISSAEYRERRSRAELNCGAVDGKGRKVSSLDESAPCALAILLNVSASEVARRKAQVRLQCQQSVAQQDKELIRNCVRNALMGVR